MPTIIYPSSVDFRWMFQRPQQLLMNMSNLGYNCIFVNEDIRIKQKHDIEQLNDNFLLVSKSYNVEYNNLKKPVILYESYPPTHNRNKNIPHDILVFDCLDFPGEQFKHWKENFEQLSAEADIILCSSYGLYNLQKKHREKIHLVKNAADFDYFKAAESIPTNKTKKIGFIGSVAPWLDYNLIRYLIEENEDKQFIFIGEFYEVKPKMKYNNVIFTGRKDYLELVSYMKEIDVFINPFKITPMTNCVSPVKLYEYLSTGKPIVSTAISEVIPMDKDYIYVAKNYKHFNELLNLAVNEKIPKKRVWRQRYAYLNSWYFRAKQFDEIIKNLNYYIV